MKMARFFVALAFMFAIAMPAALAQDEKPIENEQFGVTLTPPAEWTVAQGNDKAVANFKHPDSQSQIEVVGTPLMTPDVADVFFKTFHKTLKESNFEQKEQSETTIGETKGMQTSYKFAHSGVTLEVTIFEFTRGKTAWLVVGYMQEADREKYLADFQSVVQGMTFK